MNVKIETQQYLEEELANIHKWEEEQKGLWFWEKVGRIPFKILDKVTPQFIHNKIGIALDEIGSYLQTGGRYLVSEKAIFNKYRVRTGEEEVTVPFIVNQPIVTMDEVSQEIINSRKRIAMTQGATTGVGGIFTLTVDIPFILGICLKTLQEIALSYGYDPHDRKERIFIVKCLQFVSADIVGKQAILNELSNYESTAVGNKEQTISQVQGWREVMMTYRDNFGWKKLFQMIPIAGMIVGSIINKSMVSDIGEAGRMMYRKRRILERLKSYD